MTLSQLIQLNSTSLFYLEGDQFYVIEIETGQILAKYKFPYFDLYCTYKSYYCFVKKFEDNIIFFCFDDGIFAFLL